MQQPVWLAVALHRHRRDDPVRTGFDDRDAHARGQLAPATVQDSDEVLVRTGAEIGADGRGGVGVGVGVASRICHVSSLHPIFAFKRPSASTLTGERNPNGSHRADRTTRLETSPPDP